MVADNIIGSGPIGKNADSWKAFNGSDGLTYYGGILSDDNDQVNVYKVDFTKQNLYDTANTYEATDDGGHEYELMAASAQDVVQFASPEYAYQPDDIKDILDTYKSQIQIEHVCGGDTEADGKLVSTTAGTLG